MNNLRADAEKTAAANKENKENKEFQIGNKDKKEKEYDKLDENTKKEMESVFVDASQITRSDIEQEEMEKASQ